MYELILMCVMLIFLMSHLSFSFAAWLVSVAVCLLESAICIPMVSGHVIDGQILSHTHALQMRKDKWIPVKNHDKC